MVTALGAVQPHAEAHQSSSGEVIIAWNQLAQVYIGGLPFSQARQYAMVHIAMADAVVAIEGRYEPFRVTVWAPRGASAEAAAGQAGHDVLVSLFDPSTTAGAAAIAAFDSQLASDLASIPPGLRGNGVQAGKKAAAGVIAWRQGDGFATADPRPTPPAPAVILPSTIPGIWRQTASGAAQFSKLGEVEPFALLSATQFLPGAPPQLESPDYATSYNEVKDEGRRPTPIPSTIPSFNAKQRTALLWAGGLASGNVPTPYVNVTSAFRVWQNVARDVSRADGMSLTQTARLYALLTASIFDSVQTSHTSKFIYRLWRPETAIANASTSINPDTAPDAAWQPLLTTPPYPSHSSNMQCIGAGAARMLRDVFGTDAKSFTAAWYASNTVTPPATTPPVVFSAPYTSFWSLAVEEGNSRVWGGIHFRFELDASLESCANVADYIFANKMRPRSLMRFY